MKVLVTGAAGFIGRHLVTHLASSGREVRAVSRRPQPTEGERVHWLVGSVTDAASVSAWLDESMPDLIIHLAAQSLPGVSWQSPAETYEININGTMNLLTALRERASRARFVMVSSSSVYAPSADGRPIRESGRLEGSSPYAVSKLAAEQGALLYGKHAGLDIVSVRPFFIIGPGKTGDVSSDFARRIVDVERGKLARITTGNLDITRDFLDIDDAVRAFDAIVAKGVSGQAYNICSGRPTTIRRLLDELKGLSRVKVEEVVDPALMRPIDEPVKVGDPANLQALGWSVRVPLADSLGRILDYWRAKA